MSPSNGGALVEAPLQSTATQSERQESDEGETTNSIVGAIENFLTSMEGVRQIAPYLESTTLAMLHKHRKDFENERDRFGIIVSEKHEKQRITFPANKLSHALRLMRKANNAKAAHKTLPNMLLLALVSQYDAFISDLLKALFQMRPELVFTTDKQVKFSDIAKVDSLEEVKLMIIEKEVESVVRQSHAKQFDKLEKLFGVELREGLDVWPEFIELTERRNLLAHTNGIVSTQYVAVCRDNGVPEDELPGVGERLSFSSDYFENACNVLFEISLKLGHVLWRKILPDDLRSSDIHYNSRCFELIKSGQYGLAIKMLNFICDTVIRHSGQELRLYMEINRCNAYRLKGRKDRCKELLSEIDTSALGIEYKLAEAILCDEYERAAALMKSIGPEHSVITAFAYSDWPIFEGFRDSEYFLTAYEEVFTEPFTITTDDESVEAAES